MKTIGIKLADGSFFPVMEEGSNQSKQLELTTANNNQTCVMVDLYRSETSSMDDAEYIDTLKIENLVEHPNGEPNLAFSIQLDENNQLTANIQDPETGATSDSVIPLVTRTEEELATTDDYTISEATGIQSEETIADSGDELSFDDALPDMDMSFDEPAQDSLPDMDMNFDEPAETPAEEPVDNFVSSQSEEGPISFKGLYDKETEMGDSSFHEEKTAKKSKLYVWICLICALICIIATALILILAPLKMKKTPVEPDQIALYDLKDTAEASEKKETPKAPSAKDNEIVVIKQAETVEPSPAAKTNCSNVKYKLKWGDTLWDIANTYYKNPWKYHKIAKYNNIKNPDHIISGTVIVIPAE